MPAAPTVTRVVLAGLLAAACGRAPELGEPTPTVLTPSAAPKVVIESATAGAADRLLVVTYRLTDRGAPVTGAAATSLAPNWTLAWLSTEPVSGLPAWRSLLLTGSQTATSLPPAGPGTPAAFRLSGVKQPGAETTGTTVELGDGRFTYTFSSALPLPAPPALPDLRFETLRVGVFLRGATGTADTNATHDFVPAGGTPGSYALVEDASCNACHGTVVAHGRRIGVRLCVTCHTWQCTDPDTIDPAAIAPATRAEYPNPMEMGRLIHRIHRGKKLPTLFKASDWNRANRTWPPVNPLYGATGWPAAPFTLAPPAPFNGTNAVADTDVKFSVVGYQSSEFVFGRIATRVENFQPARRLAEGIGYPQDLRNCDACHAGAPQADAIGRGATTGVSISRRTCSGCHPDVFYGDPDDPAVVAPDATHLAHTGGKQTDDTACVDCHVVERSGGPKLYAPIDRIHRPLNDRVPSGSPRWSRATGQIVAVQDMKPGLNPVITFRLFDRYDDVSPLNTTTTEPPTDPDPRLNTSSPIPRGITPSFILVGPATDYLNGNVALRTSPSTSLTATGGLFTFTSSVAIPSTASGTWAIGMEGRRRATPTLYDPATDTFAWPYTGEQVTEWLSNDVKFVDLATGALTSSATAYRRDVVDQHACEKCHLELNLHGGNRHDVPQCLLCHTPDATDWDKRPRDTRTVADGGVVGTGMVLLHDPIDPAATTKSWGFATLDGLEERSIHMKTMVHRIHVGEREGAASLEGIRPFVVYGFRSATTAVPNAFFFDDVRFPGDLADCELCHFPDKWTIEAIPAAAQPTTANERGTLLHTGTSTTPATAAHKSTDPKVLPIAAACLSCHTSGAAVDHAASKTSSGVEQCGSCHGEGGADSVRKHHAVP